MLASSVPRQDGATRMIDGNRGGASKKLFQSPTATPKGWGRGKRVTSIDLSSAEAAEAPERAQFTVMQEYHDH